MSYLPGLRDVFTLTVEVRGGTPGAPIHHGAHLGTCERDARLMVEYLFKQDNYQNKGRLFQHVTMGLHRRGELVDVYDGEWNYGRRKRYLQDIEAMQEIEIEEYPSRRTSLPLLKAP